MRLPDERQWGQLPDEEDFDFVLFRAYLDQPRPRLVFPLPDLSKYFDPDPTSELTSSAVVTLADKWQWRERAKHYDQYVYDQAKEQYDVARMTAAVKRRDMLDQTVDMVQNAMMGMRADKIPPKLLLAFMEFYMSESRRELPDPLAPVPVEAPGQLTPSYFTQIIAAAGVPNGLQPGTAPNQAAPLASLPGIFTSLGFGQPQPGDGATVDAEDDEVHTTEYLPAPQAASIPTDG